MSTPANPIENGLYVGWTLALTRCAADVANYCDHVEHNEFSDRQWVLDCGRSLRELAYTISASENLNIKILYAERLRNIEARNILWSSTSVDGPALVDGASTWRELQSAQIEHDICYHPDVSGLSKYEQLRHYAFHVAKLAGAAADVATGRLPAEDFCRQRLPDLLLFGIKLSTVCNEKLSDQANLSSPV